jgi:NhaA family Na+:H+ antiporter
LPGVSPANLIIFLTALAIADDLGAVLVIALFYTAQLDWSALGLGAVFLAILVLFNRGGIRRALPYALIGGCLWLALLQSGIHATVAGVLLAFTIPARPAFTPQQFSDRLDALQKTLREKTRGDGGEAGADHRMAVVADNLEKSAWAVQSPQQRLEHALGPWVTFIVIPLFALANASIDFSTVRIGELLTHPVTWASFSASWGENFWGSVV